MIDLQQFCSKDEERYYLLKPFSMGEWTYATNGHICVRVPRLPDIAESDKAPKAQTLFKERPEGYQKPNFPDLPELSDMDCPACDGRGTEHDCDDCQCGCDACDDTGQVTTDYKVGVGVSGIPFALHYIRMIAGLPGLEIAKVIVPKEPMAFRFDGGEGILMPLNGKATGGHIGDEVKE